MNPLHGAFNDKKKKTTGDKKKKPEDDIFSVNSSYRAYSSMMCQFVFPEDIPRPYKGDAEDLELDDWLLFNLFNLLNVLALALLKLFNLFKFRYNS